MRAHGRERSVKRITQKAGRATMSPASAYANPTALVSTEWVNDHLDDPHVRLLEVDVDTSAYERGHLCCAVGLNWTTQLGDPIRRDLLSRAAFERLMRDCGVSNQTRLIFYGDNNNWFAAFAYWISKIYGHQDAALMNGGRKSGSWRDGRCSPRCDQSSQRPIRRPGRTSVCAPT
jgi:3-mercaptopyruvate sulfurtransferase SseA